MQRTPTQRAADRTQHPAQHTDWQRLAPAARTLAPIDVTVADRVDQPDLAIDYGPGSAEGLALFDAACAMQRAMARSPRGLQ